MGVKIRFRHLNENTLSMVVSAILNWGCKNGTCILFF